MSEKVLIVSEDDLARYAYVTFWRPNESGYTVDVDEAGRYEPGEVKRDHVRLIEVPESVAIRLARRSIPAEALLRWEHDPDVAERIDALLPEDEEVQP